MKPGEDRAKFVKTILNNKGVQKNMISLTNNFGGPIETVYGYEQPIIDISNSETSDKGFVCKRIQTKSGNPCRVKIGQCMENYVNVNSFATNPKQLIKAIENSKIPERLSPCLKCPIGEKIREAYADEKITPLSARKAFANEAKRIAQKQIDNSVKETMNDWRKNRRFRFNMES